MRANSAFTKRHRSTNSLCASRGSIRILSSRSLLSNSTRSRIGADSAKSLASCSASSKSKSSRAKNSPLVSFLTEMSLEECLQPALVVSAELMNQKKARVGCPVATHPVFCAFILRPANLCFVRCGVLRKVNTSHRLDPPALASDHHTVYGNRTPGSAGSKSRVFRVTRRH
jgi:hypothetical protein